MKHKCTLDIKMPQELDTEQMDDIWALNPKKLGCS